ncbi:MlaD family protein [Sphingomonas sp. MJ1 (PH-R8)]|uniref:MlaD family protein n=1 Tax=Sphingomonas sp. MJ1 (PH-R8) TaxID=3112950 RepID=UPI003A84F9E1
METKSNWLAVGVVVTLLVSTLLLVVIWFYQAQNANGPTYEIRFKQSVSGLEKGAAVKVQGVPIGRVTEVRLNPSDPASAITRLAITEPVPILEGTRASIERSLLDGSATLSLDLGRGKHPLLAVPGEPLPVIPEKSSSLLGGGSDPAALIARISTSADAVSERLDADGLSEIEKDLTRTARESNAWQSNAGRVAGQLTRSDKIAALGRTIERAGNEATRLRRSMEVSRGALGTRLRWQLKRADESASAIGEALERRRPAIRRLDDEQRELQQTFKSLRNPIRRVGEAAERLSTDGIQSRGLPDYHPTREKP